MIKLPEAIKAKYQAASRPDSRPSNQAFSDFLLAKMDEADAVALEYPVTFSHEDVFTDLRGRYTKRGC
jgi:hypothetical protein